MKNNICLIRKKINLSQHKLAKMIGISRQHLSSIEKELKEPGGAIMLRIAKVLNMRVEEIFFIKDVNYN